MELTTAEFGMVVSSFGFAKMIGNVPSAILVERHGRKVKLKQKQKQSVFIYVLIYCLSSKKHICVN